MLGQNKIDRQLRSESDLRSRYKGQTDGKCVLLRIGVVRYAGEDEDSNGLCGYQEIVLDLVSTL